MLTAFQCEVVAYIGDGEVYCPECTYTRCDYVSGDFEEVPQRIVDDLLEKYGYTPLLRYTVEDEWPGGLWCGECQAEIVEPSDDYCTSHDEWRHDDAGFCEQVWRNGQDGFSDGCSFPEAE